MATCLNILVCIWGKWGKFCKLFEKSYFTNDDFCAQYFFICILDVPAIKANVRHFFLGYSALLFSAFKCSFPLSLCSFFSPFPCSRSSTAKRGESRGEGEGKKKGKAIVGRKDSVAEKEDKIISKIKSTSSNLHCWQKLLNSLSLQCHFVF